MLPSQPSSKNKPNSKESNKNKVIQINMLRMLRMKFLCTLETRWVIVLLKNGKIMRLLRINSIMRRSHHHITPCSRQLKIQTLGKSLSQMQFSLGTKLHNFRWNQPKKVWIISGSSRSEVWLVHCNSIQ